MLLEEQFVFPLSRISLNFITFYPAAHMEVLPVQKFDHMKRCGHFAGPEWTPFEIRTMYEATFLTVKATNNTIVRSVAHTTYHEQWGHNKSFDLCLALDD